MIDFDLFHLILMSQTLNISSYTCKLDEQYFKKNNNYFDVLLYLLS